MSERKKPSPWPHGQPTATCERCNGTGLNRARVKTYESSRAHYDDDKTRVEQTVCEGCAGRGRVIAHGHETRSEHVHRM